MFLYTHIYFRTAPVFVNIPSKDILLFNVLMMVVESNMPLRSGDSEGHNKSTTIHNRHYKEEKTNKL